MLGQIDHESLELIQETAVKAAGIDVSKRVALIPSADVKEMILIDKDGCHSFLPKSDPTRMHRLLSVEDVVLYVGFVDSIPDGCPIVWVSRGGIVVSHDDARIEGHHASYRFTETPEFKLIREGLSKEGMSARDFIALLRVKLARSFASEDLRQQLIRSVRSIRTTTNQVSGQGSGSYETGLISTANEAIAWPESFTLEVPVFDDLSLTTRLSIDVVLEVDANNQSKPFTLTPIASDLTRAVNQTLAEAVATIRSRVTTPEKATPVFLGEVFA